MARSGPEVADIFRRYGEAYRAQHTSLSTAQRRVMTAIELCRTAALGGTSKRATNADTGASPSTAALWADPVMGSWRPRRQHVPVNR